MQHQPNVAFDADAVFDGTYLFDVDNDWLAFHDRGNVFAAAGEAPAPATRATASTASAIRLPRCDCRA